MPAYFKCPFCGFDGPHGFTEPGVGGIMHFYHDSPDTNKCDGSWEVDGQVFPTRVEAWKQARTKFPKDIWRDAWDARILEGNEPKANRLFKKWREESDTG
jgi:hypothetical protein